MDIRIFERTMNDIDQEVRGTKDKFPSNKFLMAALTEEVGELAQALIDHDRSEAGIADVYAEAIQVAAMAIRLALEGSEEFSYEYDVECYQKFKPTKKD